MKQTIQVDNLEFWHDVMCAHLFRGECSHADPNFKVDLSLNRTEDMQFTRIRGVRHDFLRTERHVRNSNLNDFVIVVQLRGQSILFQDRREVLLQPGELTCTDSTRPVQLQLGPDFEHLVVQIPRRLFSMRSGLQSDIRHLS